MAEQQGFTRPASDPAADPSKVASGDSTVPRADPIGVGTEAQNNLAGATTADTVSGSGIDQLSRTDAVQVQFPSLAGHPNVEVAQRSADVTKGSTKQHTKIFRIFTAGLEFVADEFDHSGNFTATRQYMIEHGLRPVGDVSFVGAEKYDEKNTDLTYQVEALPAAVATDADNPDQAHAVVSQG